jgi:serine/threonine protein kinase
MVNKYYAQAFKKGKMRDFYRIMDPPLGTGSNGEVHECIFSENIIDKNSNSKSYRAVKVLSKAYMEEKDYKNFRNEISALKQLSHPNILKMYHFFEDSKRYMLVFEICRGGELGKIIK